MRLRRIIVASVLVLAFASGSRPVSSRPERTSIQEFWHGKSLGVRAEPAAQQLSNRCLTPYFWCYIPQYGPAGTPCWCASPNGPVAGRLG